MTGSRCAVSRIAPRRCLASLTETYYISLSSFVYFRSNRQIRQICILSDFKRKSSVDFFFEGFEEGDDEDDDDEDEWEGGQDGAGLESFESSGPEQNSGGEGLNDAPCEFDMVWWVEVTVGGECPEHEGGRICGGNKECGDQDDGDERHDRAHWVLLEHCKKEDFNAFLFHDSFQGYILNHF